MKPDPGLIARIAAAPEDPEPRLACAEWLEKHQAAPRAELIRAQLALLERLNPVQRTTLRQRVDALLKEHGKAWAAELPGMKAEELSYRRGFIEQLALPEKRLAEHGEELLSREPVSRLHVEVQDGKGLAKAAEAPWFEQVRWLKLTGKVDAGAQALAKARHVGPLDSLLMAGVTVKGVSAMAGSETLTGLRTLSLTGSDGLDQEGITPLAQGKLALERLFLTGISLEEGLPEGFAAGEALRSLKWLALNRDELSDDDVEKLAQSKVLENLVRLELADNSITEEGALHFRSPKALPRLKHLDLSGSWYDTEEIAPLRKRLGRGLKL